MEAVSNKFPWEANISTRELLLKLISDSDETEKVDFKQDFDLHGDKEEKNELLADITSIANSYSSDYANHGFIILGVEAESKKIVGTTLTKEALSTHVDQRLNAYVNPHIRVTVEFYEMEDGKRWGAIIIKPSIELPHVITNNTGEFKRGDVWVRRGSHKCRAEASDFARFYSIRTQALDAEIEVIKAKLHLQEADFKKKLSSLERKVSSSSTKTKKTSSKTKESIEIVQPETGEKDLLSLVRSELPTYSPLERALLQEVSNGLLYIESDDIPWSLRIQAENKEEALATVTKIQDKFQLYYKALFELACFSENKKHTEVILRSIGKLSKYIHRGGVPYEALYVRYLPLVTALHIVAIASIFRKSPELLKSVVKLPLSTKERRERHYPITEALFEVRGAQNLFEALHPQYPNYKWCDGVGKYLKDYLTNLMNEYEMEDPEAMFYKAEYLLSLTPALTVPEDATFVRSYFSVGSYMFTSEASFILETFLRENKTFLESIFPKLKDILQNFDENAPKLGNRGMCYVDGIPKKSREILYPLAKVVS